MPTVTLTTDYGLRDPYAAQLKGMLLAAVPGVQLVDVCHHVDPYDILSAVFLLEHSYPSFPKGTIHICTVDHGAEMPTNFLCFEREGHIFLLPDNGIAYVLFPDLRGTIALIATSEHASTKHALADAVRQLGLGFDPRRLGPKAEEPVESIRPQPVATRDFIRGSIVHIDRYENAILNIHRSLVERLGEGRIINTRFSNSDPIVGFVQHYHEVGIGELLARYNHAGYVEIAVNKGRAASLFGLQRDQLVQIDFVSR